MSSNTISMLYAISMRIFAHRGLWESEHEQNSIRAIEAAFSRNYSVEIDLWKKDGSGEIWVGHDISNANTSFSQVLTSWEKFSGVDLALNIKCDGLLDSLFNHFESIRLPNQSNYFAFDMSPPEMYQYLRRGFPLAFRVSEFEKENVNSSDGILWLDSFTSDWYLSLSEMELKSLLSRSIVVSPELHGRDPKMVNQIIRKFETYGICLDNVGDVDNE